MTEKVLFSLKTPEFSLKLVVRDYGYPFPSYVVLINRRVYFKSLMLEFAIKKYVNLIRDRLLQLNIPDPDFPVSDAEGVRESLSNT